MVWFPDISDLLDLCGVDEELIGGRFIQRQGSGERRDEGVIAAHFVGQTPGPARIRIRGKCDFKFGELVDDNQRARELKARLDEIGND